MKISNNEFLKMICRYRGIIRPVDFKYDRKNGWVFYIDNDPSVFFVISSDLKWTIFHVSSGFLDFLKDKELTAKEPEPVTTQTKP